MVAVGSVSGAPGATALALDLARHGATAGPVLLVEADPDGGRLAARLDVPVRPGLTELAGAARSGIDPADLWRFAQPVGDSGVGLVAAHPAAEQVYSSLRAAATPITAALVSLAATLEAHVIVDAGRVRPGSPSLALVARADRTLVVAGNGIESIVAVHHRSRLLATLGDPLVVLTHARPYSAAEVARAVDLAVWGVVPVSGRRLGVRRRHAVAQLATACGLTEQATDPQLAVGLAVGGGAG